MMKDVFIKIKGIQQIGEESEEIELSTLGRLGVRTQDVLLSYEEPDETGVQSVKTLLHFRSPDTVVIKRTGAYDSRLVIRTGVRSSCCYGTPCGTMMLGVFGERVESELTPAGGMLQMCYTIDCNLRQVSRNRVEITVREV